jgi:hypothetical protein
LIRIPYRWLAGRFIGILARNQFTQLFEASDETVD